MKETHGTSETTSHATAYFSNVIGRQVTGRNLTKERAERLYAIGELQAAAEAFSDLAAGKHFRRATDHWEPSNG
ncbi:MAG: hypothetical protein ACLQKA_07750 [Bryobacteraceae bacterium]